MTNDGNFNINNLNTVKIPAITKGIQSPYPSYGGVSAFPRVQFYYDSTYIYMYPIYDDGGKRALVNDVGNAEFIVNSQVGGYNECMCSVYPEAINGYFYNFSICDEFGQSGGGAIFRAPVGEPMAWYNTGLTTGLDSTHPMMYSNGTNIWLIGGVDSAESPITSVYVAATATPTSFASAVYVLPAARVNGTIVTVGSTIYMYGGYDGATTVNTIFSAPTSDPANWTDTAATIPALLQGCAGYNDGTYIYLFGGEDETTTLVDTIYRAPIGTPTVFSPVGTIPVAHKNMGFFVNGLYAYLLADEVVFRALLTDLLTWTALAVGQDALALDVRSSHVIKTDETIYMIGGWTDATSLDSTKTDHIQSASVTNPLIWTDLGALLPAALGGGQLIKTKNYYYIIGASSTNYYRAPVADPTDWDLAGTDGPSASRGRALIHDGQLYYIGGQFIVGTPSPYMMSCTIDSSSSPAGSLSPWKSHEALYHNMTLPISLASFALIVSGNYVYVLGGFTTGPTANYNIYRNDLNDVNEGWVLIGTTGNPSVDATVVVINNYVYVIGGGSTVGTSDDIILCASMSELANGVANFVEENTAGAFMAEAAATTVNDDVYFFGGRTATAATDLAYRTTLKSEHVLIMPKVPETVHSIPTIELKSGALGSYSSFQRTGILPWLVTDK